MPTIEVLKTSTTKTRVQNKSEQVNEVQLTEQAQLPNEEQDKKAKTGKMSIWLKILLVLTLSIVALVIGAIVGYGVIGDGKPMDALKIETWRHIYDLVVKK